jgi:hypothetical protein
VGCRTVPRSTSSALAASEKLGAREGAWETGSVVVRLAAGSARVTVGGAREGTGFKSGKPGVAGQTKKVLIVPIADPCLS